MVAFYVALVRALNNLAGVLVALIFLTVFSEVMGRNLFNVSIPATFEISIVLLVFTAFIAAAAAFGQGAHFKVVDLTARLRGRKRRVARLATDVVSITFLLVLGYFGLKLAFGQMDQPSASLKIPYGLIYLSMPIFAALSVILLAIRNLAPSDEIDARLARLGLQGD
jgi:TRAP-type C4-dicarboxylate transport system permease small subunit